MNLNLLFLMMNLTFSNEILKIFYKINRNIKKTIIFYLNITKYLLNRYISMINIVACKFDRIKPFYTIVELIENRKQADFTNCLCRAAKSGSKEICTYIINQKFNVSYDKIFQKILQDYGVSCEILLLLFNNSRLKSESSIFLPLLRNSIRNSNKNFVEFLIERSIFYDECLIDSIMYGSFNHNEIMKIILKHNSNSFVNKGTSKGTALYVSASSINATGGAGGSGYVYNSSTSSNYPNGCKLNSSFYLENSSTIDGKTSFPSPSGDSNEVGHSENGFAKITPL